MAKLTPYFRMRVRIELFKTISDFNIAVETIAQKYAQTKAIKGVTDRH